MNEANLELLGILVLLLPAAGAVLAGALGSRVLKGTSHWPAILGVGGAAVASILLASQVWLAPRDAGAVHPVLYQWFSPVEGSWFNVEFWIDPLTAIMLVTVTVVSTLVVIYSRDYMRHHNHPERGYERFFAFLALFVFSMSVLVIGGNFVLLYLGWEAVGLCSYLLIGFYYERPSAAAAAKKAFLVNRIGDFGFGLGILLVYLTFRHLDYATVFDAARHALDHDAVGVAAALNIDPSAAAERIGVITHRLPVIALLLFCGAVGKSAQLPLYVWLPDAMEGPSPVSALIHAATMVTGGVYMMVRCGVIFTSSGTVMLIVALVGGFTALFAAIIALAQYDMKRILAYSTISQLGYMFLGVGVFAASSAIFHLFTHAFFKALLFLAAGSVMHAMGGIIDMRRFSGLKRILPWTFWTMLIGGATLAGFPLLSAFWSKDQIIHEALAHNWFLGTLSLVAAALTAFYTFRMIFVAFWGEQRVPEGVSAHESGPWMVSMLVVLAICSIFAGFVGVTVELGGFLGLVQPESGPLHRFLAPVVTAFTQGSAHGAESYTAAEEPMRGFIATISPHWLMYLSSLIAIGGIVVAYIFYVTRPWIPQLVRDAAPRAYRVVNNKFYVDELYDRAIVRPLHAAGVLCWRIDDFVIDGILWLITAVPRLFGFICRSLQQGALQGYGLSMVAGLAIIVILVLFA